MARLPFSLKVLLENLLRTEGNGSVTRRRHRGARQLGRRRREPSKEIAFTPARVLMQDFTGVPAVVDLAAMRDAMAADGRRPGEDQPARAGRAGDRPLGAGRRVRHPRRLPRQRRARVRAQPGALRVPALGPGRVRATSRSCRPTPGSSTRSTSSTSRASCSRRDERLGARRQAYPDTLVGTDSHTTMVNGLGVLGWGVGGIEAEAAMLGQPMSMLIPQVLGFRLHGELPEGATATDLVLTVTEMLRERGVVGMFVEFYGAGLAGLPIADRATIGNMSPEFGSTCAIFPIDAETLALPGALRAPAEQIALVEAYAREQGLWHDERLRAADLLRHDRARPRGRRAEPRRPQAPAGPRPARRARRTSFREALGGYVPGLRRAATRPRRELSLERPAGQRQRPARRPTTAAPQLRAAARRRPDGACRRRSARRRTARVHARRRHRGRARPRPRGDRGDHELHEHLQPVGDDRRRASSPATRSRGACSSQAVGEDLARARLEGRHRIPRPRRPHRAARGARLQPRRLRLHDLHRQLRPAAGGDLRGGRRARPRGRLGAVGQPQLRGAHQPRREDELPRLAARCASPTRSPARWTSTSSASRSASDEQGEDVYLRDIWPSEQEVAETIGEAVRADMFRNSYGEVFAGDERWNGLEVPGGERFAWERDSTYVRLPPYFQDMPPSPSRSPTCAGARVLALLGDSVTTDHISPAGSIKRDGPAGAYLQEQGVAPRDFNSYGSRRGNHEVMMRGTFANIRLRNLLAAGYRGRRDPVSRDARGRRGGRAGRRLRRGRADVDLRRRHALHARGRRLVVLAGKEYGSGSSRDWAAKGTKLLGVRAVIAQSFERIHRSNLIGMGVLPLQFPEGESAESLGLTGEEVFSIERPGRGDGRRRRAAARGARERPSARGVRAPLDRVRRARAHRHAARGRVLPPRRHPPVRPASAAASPPPSRPTRAQGGADDRSNGRGRDRRGLATC